VDGALIVAANFIVDLQPDETVSMWWAVSNTQVSLKGIAAKTTPYVAPLSPAAVATLRFVSTLSI
jgi:hypothetical protein